MSLDYNLTAVQDTAKTDDGWPVTEALIFATMTVGINRITEANADEFHTRLTAANRVMGNPRTIALVEIRERVGLHTNATPLTAAAFRRRLTEQLMDDAARDTRRQATDAS